MSRVCELDASIAIDPHGKAGDQAAPLQALVQQSQDCAGVRCEFECGANSADDQSGEHARFQSLSGDISHDDQSASIAGVRKDLEEIAADFAGGKIDALDGEAGRDRKLLRDEVLLDLARRGHFARHLCAFPGVPLLIAKKQPHQEDDDAKRDKQFDTDQKGSEIGDVSAKGGCAGDTKTIMNAPQAMHSAAIGIMGRRIRV